MPGSNPTRTSHINISIEREREEDGHWIAEVQQLQGRLSNGTTADEVMANAPVLALRAVAERLEHGEPRPVDSTIAVPAAA